MKLNPIRCAVAIACLAASAPLGQAAVRAPSALSFSGGSAMIAAAELKPAVTDSNATPSQEGMRPVQPPIDPRKKTKAGFLAAAGLVILSLLALAVGVALLRAFRQR